METLRSGLDEYVSSWVGPTEATGQPSRSRACCYLVRRTLARYGSKVSVPEIAARLTVSLQPDGEGDEPRRRPAADGCAVVRRISASNHLTVNIEHNIRRRSG